MAEHVLESRISVFIDTNKTTYHKSFETIGELLNYLEELASFLPEVLHLMETGRTNAEEGKSNV
jgi:hypothetical protein